VADRATRRWSVIGASTPTLGLNTFILTSPIAVNAGDLVGYYTQGAGVAEFDLNPPGSFAFGNLSGKMLFTGNNSGLANATNFVDSSNRTYSIDVVGTAGIAVPDPSTLVLLSVGAVGLIGYDWRRRKAAA
jgi:PEP-CTERM motif